MAAKSFQQFVTDVASAVDDMDHKIKEDPEVQKIFASSGTYQERVSRAISYWRGRPAYIDVNKAFADRLKELHGRARVVTVTVSARN